MIRLEIDGVQLPVDGLHRMALSCSASDLADVQSGRSARRVMLTVPATPATAALFGNADDPLSSQRFNAGVHRAKVEVDGVNLFEGTAVLRSAVRNGRSTEYRVEIKGDTALWARSAALRKVSAAGVTFSGVLTPEDICAGWSDNRPVKFFPVNRVDRRLTNSSVSLLPAQTVMTTDDYWPFISVDAVVKAIFADAGYEVESRFMQTPLFRSLYISGAYAVPDSAAMKRKMDFLAGRTTDASAQADYFGRVYMSVAAGSNSVGNIVDTTDEYVTGDDGNVSPTGFFAVNDSFGVDPDSGIAVFRPQSNAVVGFEYSIAYVTDHVIASRTALKGFDTLYLGNGTRMPFVLANRFADQRAKPLPGYSYKLMIFDFKESCTYRLKGTVDGVTTVLAETSQRMTALKMPGTKRVSNLQLLQSESGSPVYTSSPADWALYWGYVEERGRTEVELRLKTPAEAVSASAGKPFSDIFIEGAEPGMNFTLLKRTTLRPVFSSSAGYGSELAFGDVTAFDMRQSDLLDGLRRMFDLQFCTDETAKKVFVEPYGDFFSGETVDWSDRIDLDDEIVTEDPASAMHEAVTLGYGNDDAAVTRFNNSTGDRFGRWTFRPDSNAALSGEQTQLNPAFGATVSECGGYFEARSAAIMQVRDSDAESDDGSSGNFSTRIVRYEGLRPLASGQTWGSPYSRPEYPLAAFHFAGDDRTESFTLCFENRDGAEGLNRFHLRRLEEESEGTLLTLSLRIEPHEAAALTRCGSDGPSMRSLFRLDFAPQGAGALYALRSIEGYDPAKRSVRCTFIKIRRTL